MDVFDQIVELRREGKSAALVTVVASRGSSPHKPGARMLVFSDGSIAGTVGGGAVEKAVHDLALRVLAGNEPELVTYDLTRDLGMCCGGEMTLFVESLVSPSPLIVFGCGHVGAAIIRAAAPLGFGIVAVDELEENANRARLPQAARIMNSYERDDLGDLPFGDDTYVVIVTREHSFDQKLLEFCLPKPWRFLGTIGSPRKAHMQRERLAAKGFDAQRIAKVRCPMGIDIGALTPEEIAIAVVAELVQVRRGGPRFGESG